MNAIQLDGARKIRKKRKTARHHHHHRRSRSGGRWFCCQCQASECVNDDGVVDNLLKEENS